MDTSLWSKRICSTCQGSRFQFVNSRRKLRTSLLTEQILEWSRTQAFQWKGYKRICQIHAFIASSGLQVCIKCITNTPKGIIELIILYLFTPSCSATSFLFIYSNTERQKCTQIPQSINTIKTHHIFCPWFHLPHPSSRTVHGTLDFLWSQKASFPC